MHIYWSHLLFCPKEQTNGHYWYCIIWCGMQTGHTMWQRRCHVFCLLPCPVRITHHVILCPLFPGPSGVMQHQLDQLLILLHDRSCGETSYSLSPLSELLRVHSQDIPNRNTLGSLLKTPKRIRGAPLTKWEHQNSWRLRAKGNTIRLVSQQGLPVWNFVWNLFWPLCRNRHCRTKHTHSQSHRVSWLALHADSCPRHT